MSNATDELAMSRVGIAFVDGICARARQVWRETPHTDVGLDGQIEFKDGEQATGVFAGVQVKTGPSYIAEDGETFYLPANKDHFTYWATCALPVVGLVVDPVREIAVWVDLTAECTAERITNGPYLVTIPRTSENEFTIASVAGRIKALAASYSSQRVTKWQIDGLEEDDSGEPDTQREAVDGPTERLAWNMLCADLASPRLSANEAASVGQRLSWYFPTAPRLFQEHLRRTLKKMSDTAFARIIGAARAALDADRPDVAQQVADLIAETENGRGRVLSLLEQGGLPRADRDAAIQILEAWDEGPREDLRKAYLP